MSVTMTTYLGTQVGSDARKDATISQSASGLTTLSETIAAAASNVQHAFVCDVSAVKCFRMKATADMTVKTNSSGSPAQTLTLVANYPYVWNYGDLASFFLTTDVTTIYVSSTDGGQLDIECLYDATP